MSRPTFSLWRLNASADPALIQQTKLSPLNAKQKSSLAVIMHPHRPVAPQSTVPPAPLTSPTSLSLPTALYIRQIVQADQPQQWLNAAGCFGFLWGLRGCAWLCPADAWLDGDLQSLEDGSAPQAVPCAVPEAVSAWKPFVFVAQTCYLWSNVEKKKKHLLLW